MSGVFRGTRTRLPPKPCTTLRSNNCDFTLQERNEEAGARLQSELAVAQAQLEHIQTLYAALADDKLQHPEP